MEPDTVTTKRIKASLKSLRQSKWGSKIPDRATLTYWGKEITRFFSWQLAITALNLLTGILVVRYLPKEQYAYYTIVFATLAIFANVSNSGIEAGMNAIAGNIWQDRRKMGELVHTALAYRITVASVLSVPMLIYCAWQLKLVDAPWWVVGTLLCLMVVGGIGQLQASMYKVPIVYAKAINSMQRIEFKASLYKIIMVVGAGLFYANASTLIATAVFSFLYKFKKFRDRALLYIEPAAEVNQEMKGTMVSLFKSSVLGNLYWAVQGQITILLCSIFATTANVAEIGALAKFALIFAILNVFSGSYLFPRVSKARTPRGLLKMSGVVLMVYATAAAGFLLFTAWQPQLLLKVLGEQYYNLQPLLLLYIGVSILGIFQVQMYSLCAVRGWLRNFTYYVPVILLTQLGLVYALDLTQLRNIILFEGCVSIVGFLFNASMYATEFLKYRREYRVEASQTQLS